MELYLFKCILIISWDRGSLQASEYIITMTRAFELNWWMLRMSYATCCVSKGLHVIRKDEWDKLRVVKIIWVLLYRSIAVLLLFVSTNGVEDKDIENVFYWILFSKFSSDFTLLAVGTVLSTFGKYHWSPRPAFHSTYNEYQGVKSEQHSQMRQFTPNPDSQPHWNGKSVEKWSTRI